MASSERVPPKIKEIIDSLYLSKVPNGSVSERNEKYLASQSKSAPHVFAAIRVRKALEFKDVDKASSVQCVQDVLNRDATSIQHAIDGARLLNEIGAGAEAREGYLKAARQRWSQATAFQR